MSTGDLDVLLARLGPGVADLVRAADELVREVDPDVVRVVWPHQGTVGYGVGPAKNSEHYAYLATFARHLNLGFNRDASLEHGGLLDGTGKAFRKLTVRSAEDLGDPRLCRCCAPPARSGWPLSTAAGPATRVEEVTPRGCEQAAARPSSRDGVRRAGQDAMEVARRCAAPWLHACPAGTGHGRRSDDHAGQRMIMLLSCPRSWSSRSPSLHPP
ncbi:hypothetical protein SAMN05660350_02979 [Geodermatophilus obscurus]|uniref:YdhG-like domain-containing protein n=1 Tax=Geodermatophilus obscurus TaxID=1861 RepID=A0A1M7UCJ0_9ACTN|nr:DUF1801 domain-containing protein [Geodermatophilus obscurus]SHN80729.1 hypothetical protein SAMN05660350_02979 [Geodermatophilus obscurus]